MENAEKEAESKSLFPSVFQPTSESNPNPIPNPTNNSVPLWLCNPSFTVDLSAVPSLHNHNTIQLEEEEDEEEEGTADTKNEQRTMPSYELLEETSSSASKSDPDSDTKKKRKRKTKTTKKKKKKRSSDAPYDYYGSSRKPDVQFWSTSSSDVKPTKEYYFDSRGDRDNLAFGSLYRMDVARYKLRESTRLSELNYQARYRWNRRSVVFDGDVDAEALDSKLKVMGRYWSAKYTALESHKNLKHIRIVAPQRPTTITSGDFIPLLDNQTTREGLNGGSHSIASVVEESWEDEMFRKTREFNKMSRENPHDEKVWLGFAEFQDKVASMQPQKGARLQTLEKKISILEKATELNPDNEELLLCLMNSYQSRDSTDVLMGRWEKILMQNSGSIKLWKEFLRIIQGEFSRFKVSEMRKFYANAIQALSAACSKQYRQVCQTAIASSLDPAIVQLELGLVDIFVSLCRFEWQAGYQELATALFQAEIEYSLFCPLLLTEQNKRRLFEHFWNSNGSRIGEDGALGWSAWLEKEEEHRQKVINEELHKNEEGGWTGWSQPLSKNKETSGNTENIVDDDVAVEEFDEESETRDIEQTDDIEALLKMLGINADAEADGEVKDTATWTRWAEEELSRDSDQWMPVHARSDGVFHSDGTADREGDEHLLRVILFEDVSEYLFSMSSEEARLSLAFQFIDFYGGRISQWACTNSSSWAEKILSLEVLPDSVLDDLRKVHDVLVKAESSPSSFSLEFLLGSSNDISMRTNMMKFLCNAALLCITAFPRNYILEEAALVAEELSNTRMNSCKSSTTPCLALAKRLLKTNRQDVLLCGVYARREAAFGNIDHARKVFDMALASIEGLPLDLQSNASLLYFWYAEVEFGSSSGGSSESSSRVIHILSCFGSGVKYSPFKCQPSSLQQLKAHQGFKEKMAMLRTKWVHGITDDISIALICSAALFEELTTGWVTGIEVLNRAFSMVLPDSVLSSRYD
ncbi:uncharacterized protein LOC132283914 isoform X2 [Cornus florida]|uniref:uncharacterized protein LOC132283914 isoform X2 n=1 Tax=Cornus florida TaxID=4283 RepID=UPI0028994525|nr:uncharacterized protein LOC132283914 isoform X2 [Cornus florida]